MIAMLWVNQIMIGKRTYDEVPKLLKEQVKELLIDNGYKDLTEQESN